MHLYKRLLKFLKPHLGILVMGLLFIIITTLTDGVQLGMIIPLADIVLGGKEIVADRELPLFLDRAVGYLNSIPRMRLLNNW